MASDLQGTDRVEAGVVLTILQAKCRLGEARITGCVNEDKTRTVFYEADDGTKWVLTRTKP